MTSYVIDLALLFLCISSVMIGYRQGGYSALLGLIGGVVGWCVSLAVLPTVLELLEEYTSNSDNLRFFVAAGVLIGFVVGTYSLGLAWGSRIRQALRSRTVLRIDSIVGSIIRVLATVLIAWMIAVPLGERDAGPFGQMVRSSAIFTTIDRYAPDPVKQLPGRTADAIYDSGFPMVVAPLGRMPEVDAPPPDPELQNSPMVQAAKPSVLLISALAPACGSQMQGTGWVIANNLVMTNAHVVAGSKQVRVGRSGFGNAVNGQVVYFNPTQDIAIVRTTNLDRAPLPWASEVLDPMDDAVALGYPAAGPFTAVPGRVRDRFRVRVPTIYEDGQVEREVYGIAATIVHGNSGGPLLNPAGEVVGMIFGADTQESNVGYALTKEEIFRHVGDYLTPGRALGDSGGVELGGPVETGNCIPPRVPASEVPVVAGAG